LASGGEALKFAIAFGAVPFGVFGGYLYRSEAEKALLLAVFIAVILDWVTGLAASVKEGTPIKSSRMREGLWKLLAYFGVILLSIATVETMKAIGLPLPSVPVLAGVLAYIFAVEALSVLENIYRLSGMRIKWLKRLLEGVKQDDEPK
jgi:hypothetical protein